MDTTVVEVEAFERDSCEIENVLFGAHQRVSSCGAGLGGDRAQVLLRVTMVVGEDFVADRTESPFAQIDRKNDGIADGTEGEEFSGVGVAALLAGVLAAKQAHGFQMWSGVENRRV